MEYNTKILIADENAAARAQLKNVSQTPVADT